MDDYKPKTKLFNTAALLGDLENLKWLKTNGYLYSPYTFSCAVSNGNLENIKWLKENGCKFDKSTMSDAVYKTLLDKKFKDNIIWLIDNNCPWGDFFCYDLNIVYKLKYNKELFDLIKNLGCPWKEIY